MKKLFLPLLALLFLISCSAPRGSSSSRWMQENGKIKVLSTTSQVGDLVAYVGGGRVDNWTLISGDLDPHSYELVKGDGEKVERADLVFYNGLGLEHGASLSALLHKNPKAIPLGEAIRKKSPELILEKEGAIDPHLWMDLSLWEKSIEEIVEKLSTTDPDSSLYYEERGKELQSRMEQEDLQLREMLQKIPSEKRYLVTSHDAFRYFARAYLKEAGEENWEERFTAPEGLAPEGQLSPVDLQAVILFLQKHRVSVLFPESNVGQGVIGKIAQASRDMGFPIRLCTKPLYGDATGDLTYFEAMQRNGELLAEELSQQ
ncbi:MAG: zinc ABC transporter substrate-binding protein [Verrucomicrobiota bacterium]|nr:zinc ABC transporter substrate-binding protein [Verrucomicrobiota bacterium]